MPTYTVQVTVKLHAEDAHEAYGYIRHAVDNAKKADIEHLDSEVLETERDEDDEPCLPDGTPLFPTATLTRQARLQGLADSGVDTWREFNGEN